VGSGFRTFTAGEVLTASNVQNYLMDQSVMVFGGSAARSSAIGTANFEEGMVSYLTDTDKVEAYNGTDWVSVAPTTSQGLTLINTTSFSGVSSQALPASTFSATYTNYRIICNIRSSSTNGTLYLKMRAASTDSSASYYQGAPLYISTGTLSNLNQNNASTGFYVGEFYSAGANLSWFAMDLQAPAVAVPTMHGFTFTFIDAGGGYRGGAGGGQHLVSTAYDSANLIASAGNITGTIQVFGYNQ
jgi:hypothetical protein